MNRTRITLAVALVAAACRVVDGNGEAPVRVDRTLDREVGALRVNHGMQAEWTVGESRQVSLVGESNLLPNVSTQPVGASYSFRHADDTTESVWVDFLDVSVGTRDLLLSPTVPIRVGFSAPRLYWASVYGGSGLSGPGPVVQAFLRLEAEGGSTIALDEVTIGRLEVVARRAGSLSLSGTATRLHLELYEAGEYDGSAFTTDAAWVRLDKGSTAELSVRDAIEGSVGPGARLVVHGLPGRRDVTTEGDGSVEYRP